MSLKEVNIKIKYDSDEDDILNDFYVPTLSQSKEYYRLSGFFNSSSLSVSARGLEQFIKNNGKMKLVTSVIFSKEDIQKINEAQTDPKKIIEENFIKELDDISDEFVKDNLAALGWMIVNGNLEIKVAYPKDNISLFHPKVGILKDSEENTLTFSGSDNETKSGWQENIEEFKVFASWKSGHPEIIQSDIDSFYKYWNDNAKKVKVITIPKAVNDELIKLAPDNIDKLNFHGVNGTYKPPTFEETIKLRFYQQNALNSWFDNNCRGIFELATGTGKTITALKCLEKLFNNEDLICVVACPLMYLVEQWYNEINKFSCFEGDIYKIYGANPNWKKDLQDLSFSLKLGTKKKAIIVTTHNTFSNPKFMNIVSKFKKDFCLIVDEMHHVASKQFSRGLTGVDYKYRLGLSATPSIYMNDEATDFLMDYFGGIVSSFTIQDALSNINPETDEFYLTEYNYYPIKVRLTTDETKEYAKLTNQIVMQLSKKENDNRLLTALLNKRSHILKNASEKDDILRKILREYDDLDHLIIFSTYGQIDRVLNILGEENVTPRHEFTSNVGAHKIKEIGISERELLIDQFDKGELKALVAIKCLDEGVDVPSADKVIIMSSSTNPREYIQRRGRVLRRFKGKKIATIYDMVILPEDDGFEFTKTIIANEKRRLYDFIETAKNKNECYELLDEWGI